VKKIKIEYVCVVFEKLETGREREEIRHVSPEIYDYEGERDRDDGDPF
jgi:hypothetical protein